MGQPNLFRGGLNSIDLTALAGPAYLALDTFGSPGALFVSDSLNNRILCWRDSLSFQSGDPADLVLGQTNSYAALPLGTGADGLNTPLGLAVEPGTGNLYVADTGNNRVLRFPAPFAHLSQIQPDAVFGQPNFATRTPNSSGVSSQSMKNPRALAFDSKGNLWVADTGNHRIVRFAAASLNTASPASDLVLGQKDFTSAAANQGTAVSASGLDTPTGLVFDAQDNLYVSDFNNARVLKFAAALAQSAAAGAVFGQVNFTTRSVPSTASSSSLAGPQGLTIASGSLYVAVPADNRILVFPISGAPGAAKQVIGQDSFTSVQANQHSFPRASAATLSLPSDVKADAAGNLFVADAGNNRILAYPAGGTNAARVLGQADFASNGPNRIKAGSINAVYKMVIDYSRKPAPLFVSDSNNHRVLIWRDSAGFQTGTPADLVIGQPDLLTAAPNSDSPNGTPTATSLFSPRGLALEADGTLYVADSGNNRILRFPSPLSQPGRITPDAVLGQNDFTSNAAAAPRANSFKTPGGVAIDASGNLFVADSGNNRVLEFAPHPGTAASAIRVFGQTSFTSGTSPSSHSSLTLASPQGLATDPASNLYVVDLNANRIVVYTGTKTAPGTGASAALVLGQAAFNTGTAGSGAGALRAPVDVALDGAGTIYVSDGGNNRVIGFPSLIQIPVTGALATTVFGQATLSGSTPNFNTATGQPTPESLLSPAGLYVDRRNTLYIGDAGNSRVLHVLKPLTLFNAALNVPTAPVSLGAVVSAFAGAGLADTTESYSTPMLPFNLASREVLVNDRTLAPLFYVGQNTGFTQINFFFPTTVALGQQPVAIRDSVSKELMAGTTVSVVSTQPGLSTSNGTGNGQAAALNQDGSLNSSSNPAARGSLVTLFGTGMGPVNQTIPDGTPAPSSPLANTVAVPTSNGITCLNSQPSVCVAVGSTFADILFSGLAPNYFGLWQLNVRIPANALTGSAIPLRAVVDATPSNLVTIAIK